MMNVDSSCENGGLFKFKERFSLKISLNNLFMLHRPFYGLLLLQSPNCKPFLIFRGSLDLLISFSLCKIY